MGTNSIDQRASSAERAWLERRLRRSGFESAKASRLVTERRLDFHALLELIDRGCPPDLAERIVAPLDDHEGSP
jgi:hypothetical protein